MSALCAAIKQKSAWSSPRRERISGACTFLRKTGLRKVRKPANHLSPATKKKKLAFLRRAYPRKVNPGWELRQKLGLSCWVIGNLTASIDPVASFRLCSNKVGIP